MKKTKLSLGLISCLLSVGALAGCDAVKSSSDGVLLRYTVDGNEEAIYADDILTDYYNDSSKYQAIYDTIYSVIARNYFAKDRVNPTDPNYANVKLGKPQMEKIERDAKEKVSDDKDTAQSNADANNTKYKKEFETILESKGVSSEQELLEKYIADLQKETFEDNFYTYFIEDIKAGEHCEDANKVKLPGETTPFWNGYLKDQLPYHVSHILVKLDDTSDTNYHNGTISEANALRLYNVISDLGSGEKTFAKLAMTYNEDPGSKDKEGDLGIMDYDTSFINEFKLGIYAYEQFYNGTDVSSSNIAVSSEISSQYKDAVSKTFEIGVDDIPTVNMSVFDKLNSVAKEVNDENGKPVIDNASLVYPRNVIYNKYLNRHAVFFIEGTGTNYKKAFGDTNPSVLCADGDANKPIIAVRASSGGEQEIHLMVVNRSPFDATVDGVSLEQYYTTYYPAQDFYPKDSNGKKLDTYVNFLTNDTSDTKTRAEEVASKLKSYNSDKLGKYIFLKYMAEENITFAEENKALEEALMKWIKTSVEKSEDEKKETWTKTWNEYLDKLVRQNSERSKLIPESCVLLFSKANSSETIDGAATELGLTTEQVAQIKADLTAFGVTDVDTYCGKTPVSDLFKKEGGIFNDGKAHL